MNESAREAMPDQSHLLLVANPNSAPEAIYETSGFSQNVAESGHKLRNAIQ